MLIDTKCGKIMELAHLYDDHFSFLNKQQNKKKIIDNKQNIFIL